jgi:Family of unknown function (DUF6152)
MAPGTGCAEGDGRRKPKSQASWRHKLETPMKFKALGLAGLAVAALAIPAAAHHSFAMFDATQKMTVDGTVKEFQWTNPHAWILMMVANKDGQLDQWSIEMGGPGGLARQGWIPKTLTPGMSISVVLHPLRNGNHGGQFLAVTLPDGKQLGNPNDEPRQEGPGR